LKTEPTHIQGEILRRLRDAGGTLPLGKLRDLWSKSSLHEGTLTSLERKGYVKVDGGVVKLVEPPSPLTDPDKRCSPRLDAGEVAEMERRSDVNLVHHFAGELRRIRSGAPPCSVLSKGIRCKLEVAGMLKRGRMGNWALSAECIEILHGR
jgi:hypothetical protein